MTRRKARKLDPCCDWTASITLRSAENSAASDEIWKERPRPAYDAGSTPTCGNAKMADVASEKRDRAAVLLDGAGDLMNESGLARAIRSDQRVDFACAKIEADIVRRFQRAEAFPQIPDGKDGLSHDALSQPAGR